MVSEPIAIIGAACRLPGAPDVDALWQMLLQGTDAVTEIPEARWNKAQFFHPERGHAGKVYTFAAGVVGDPSRFDPGFFGISPREATQMDPQQRLLLELAYEAVEDAGLDLDRIAGEPIGVFVGGSSWDYLNLNLGDPASTDAYSMIGVTLCSLANRISYAFDLRGPSFTVDTACSSSLVALHQACEAIRHGQIDMALVGGVSLLLAPQSYVGFCAASMLSPTGRCHAFDARADGYVRAEGGGVVALKPLSAAQRDGDPIRAIIRATGVNSDGRTTGLSLPNREAQAALLETVYSGFGLDPERLAYLEAHGTGTPAGDPIEASALGEVLGRRRSRPLPIGSIKTNIGHLEAASGMAGLIKAMLVAEHGAVPPSLHFETPNSHIPFDELNLKVVSEPLSWTATTEPPLVGINSFGFGGTNAHAVIEGAAPMPDAPPAQAEAMPPLLLSARSEDALRALAAEWRTRLDQVEPMALPALARGAAVHRTQHQRRLAVPAGSVADMRTALDAFATGRPTTAAATNTAVTGEVAFIFSGNGSQWAGMAADAMAGSAAFRAALADVDTALRPWLGWSAADALAAGDGAVLRNTETAQPLLFAVQVATVIALRAHGVTPSQCMGHSVGEVAAAWASGALTLDEAARVIAARSRAQQLRHGVGAMAVLGLGAEEAAAALATAELADAGLELAAHNSTAAVTVAGETTAIDRLAEVAGTRGWRFTRLDLDYAFHSAVMDPIRSQLLTDLDGLTPAVGRLPFVSTVTGGVLGGDALDATYWWRNVREPVLFADAARAMIARGARIFVEIGPHPVVQAYLADALRLEEREGRVVPSLSRRAHRGDPIAALAARVHAAGGDIRGGAAFAGAAAVHGLPRYPWQREHFWVPTSDEADDLVGRPFEHPLLGRRVTGDALEWRRHAGLELMPWVADHMVGGAAVMPAAALLDAALAAARERFPDARAVDLLDLEIGRALVIEAHVLRELRFRIGSADGDFELASRPRLSGEPWSVHVTGRMVAADTAIGTPARSADRGAVRRLESASLYAVASAMGLDYGPLFRVVDHVEMWSEAEATVSLRAPVLPGDFRMSPNLVDGAMQGLLALAADRLGSDMGVLPWRFGRVRLFGAGAVPASARLHVTRVGPRSVRADVQLLDEAGDTIAELAECWFVRVALGRRPRLEEMFFHPVTVRAGDRAGPEEASPRASVLAGVKEFETSPPESRLLADAFVTAAAVEALRGMAEPGGARLVPQRLLREGVIAAESRALLDRLLRWLAADGVATQADDGSWRFAADLPSSSEILRTLFFDMPRGVADIGLMALAGDTLAATLREGPANQSALPTALWDQFLMDSPAGAAAANALAACVRDLCRAEQGRALRILEIGARRGTFTRRLIRALEGLPVTLVAATGEADLPSLRAALSDAPGVRAIAWKPGDPTEDVGFDVLVGLYPVALNGWGGAEVAQIAPRLAGGGTVLLGEPAPNRLWQIIRPDALPPADPRRLATWLESAGFSDVQTRAIETELWPVELLEASAPAIARQASAAIPAVTLFADGDAADLAARLEATGVVAEVADWTAFANLADLDALAGPIAILWSASSSRAVLADRLATLARLATQGESPLALTLFLRATGDGDEAAAAVTGARRVLANEAAQVTLRLVRLDPALSEQAAAQAAAHELRQPDGESEVAWSQAGRSVARVRRGLPPRADRAAKGLRLTVERPGLLDSLAWVEAEPGVPGTGEIAIEVKAAGLNFRDVMWSMGLLPDEALLDGFAGPTLGLECAGVVTAIGPGVANFAVGDAVAAFSPAALATQCVTKAHAAMRVPVGLDFPAAATLPVAFLTVAYALGHLAQVEAGETVLIHGGAGGVGLAAIQYARARGARVIATAGSPAKRALLRALGIEAVLDSRSLAFADEVMALTNGEGVDIVLNSLAGEAMRRSLGLVKAFGRFLELGKRDFYENSAVGLRPFRHNVSYFGIDADQLPVKRPALAAKLFGELSSMFAAGTLRPLPHRLFDYADVEDAFRLMQASGHIGKIVLAPGAKLPRTLSQPHRFTARADRAYLVTGGLDGFGLEAARWLARAGGGHLALLGRRGPQTPGADARLAELAAAGVDARAYAVDVADEAALATVLDRIRADQAPIAGVIHAAVAMDDALLKDLDAGRFARALGPKLAGAEALDRLTRADPLDLFVLFSSVTTPLGNPGQGNYVAANAAIEAVAERRHGEGLPALAVQWGPIGDAGYLVRETQVSEMLARQLGGSHLSAAEALDTLPMLLDSGLPVAGVATVRWPALRARLPLLASTLFAEMEGDEASETSDVDLRALLAECTPQEARERVTVLLVEEVARIMKLPADRIEAGRPLAELGMDSLMAVELRLAVEQRFGITVPLLALSEGATLAAMAGRIVRGLGEGGEGEPQTQEAELAARLQLHEGGRPEGPADGAEAPSEPGFAAAAVTSP